MHKDLLILGLLRPGPMYGYELNRFVVAHGEIYRDLKKANLYYLLDRLAKDGYLTVAEEPGARGARGARLIYTITEAGQQRFNTLLREVIINYEPEHNGIDVAVIFLSRLPSAEAIGLLEQRRAVVAERRQRLAAELGDPNAHGPLRYIANDHLLSQIDAELAWIDRSLVYLVEVGWASKGEDGKQK
jgi:DNA-binding PadR family transcriptional regulator